MQIILSKQHESATKKDVINFINSAIKHPLLFFKQPVIKSIEIMTYHQRDIDQVNYYSLVKIEPESAAKRAIKKLNRKPLKGKRVNVRTYFVRNRNNDRRDPSEQNNECSDNRRQIERRQQQLLRIAPSFEWI